MSTSLFTEYCPLAQYDGRQYYLFLLKDTITGNSFTYLLAPPGTSPIVPNIFITNRKPRWEFTCNLEIDLPTFCVHPTPAHTIRYINGVLTVEVRLFLNKFGYGGTKPVASRMASAPQTSALIELLIQDSAWIPLCGYLQRATVMG